jgi:hypothetical protein
MINGRAQWVPREAYDSYIGRESSLGSLKDAIQRAKTKALEPLKSPSYDQTPVVLSSHPAVRRQRLVSVNEEDLPAGGHLYHRRSKIGDIYDFLIRAGQSNYRSSIFSWIIE